MFKINPGKVLWANQIIIGHLGWSYTLSIARRSQYTVVQVIKKLLQSYVVWCYELWTENILFINDLWPDSQGWSKWGLSSISNQKSIQDLAW